MRPTIRKAKPPAPRKMAIVKRPDAERELMRMRKLVRGALSLLEHTRAVVVDSDDMPFAQRCLLEAMDAMRKALR